MAGPGPGRFGARGPSSWGAPRYLAARMDPPRSVGPLARLYRRHLLPGLVHRACSGAATMRQRAKVVPLARGRVLEVGIGSGLNLPYYDPRRVTEVWGLDPAPEMTERAARAASTVALRVGLMVAGGEEIPLPAAAVDTVVLTYTLCTIADPGAALREVARVLRPGGRLLFCEHGTAPDAAVRRWQERLNPVWRRLSGGCHLDRDVPALLSLGGFRVESLESGYIPLWRPAGYNYWGAASPR